LPVQVPFIFRLVPEARSGHYPSQRSCSNLNSR
jgi:hypothetical protein